MDDGLKDYSENDILLDGENTTIIASTLLFHVEINNIHNQPQAFSSMNLHLFIFIHIKYIFSK
jgi:hypothetical protein